MIFVKYLLNLYEEDFGVVFEDNPEFRLVQG